MKISTILVTPLMGAALAAPAAAPVESPAASAVAAPAAPAATPVGGPESANMAAPAAPIADNADIPEAITVDFSGQIAADREIVEISPVEGEKLDLAETKKDKRELMEHGLAKRVAPIVIPIAIAGFSAFTIITKMAIEIGADTIKNLGQWTRAREEFTRTTTRTMWAKNPDYRLYAAAVCYNKGYRLAQWWNIAGKMNAKFSLGMLNTDYDCMYLGAGNAFWTDSEGGYINLSYTYDPRRCTFDGRTGDLTCPWGK